MPTPFCASATDATRGSGFSSRSAVRPPHDGLIRMGRYNLTGALAAGQQQDRQTLRPPSPVVPVRTFYCRSRSVISLPAISAAGSSNRRNCGAVLAPAKRATVNHAADPVEQHLMQDGELLAHDPADVEQRLGDRGQPRKARDELANPRLVSRAADGADF